MAFRMTVLTLATSSPSRRFEDRKNAGAGWSGERGIQEDEVEVGAKEMSQSYRLYLEDHCTGATSMETQYAWEAWYSDWRMNRGCHD